MSTDRIISYPDGHAIKQRGVFSKIFHFLGFKGTTFIILFILVGTFAFQNIESTSVQFLFWKILEVSKLYLILLSILLGAVFGIFLGLRLKKTVYISKEKEA